MANLNKVMLIGRLTREPEPIEVRGATQGAKFGFAVNNRKQNTQTQQWEDVPVFIDCEIWNRGEGRQGDRFLQTVRRGHQVFIEGHLKMDSWEDKNGGGKRTKLTVVVENFQYLERREDGAAGSDMPAPRSRPAVTSAPAGRGGNQGGYGRNGGGSNFGDDDGEDQGGGSGGGKRASSPSHSDDDIPF